MDDADAAAFEHKVRTGEHVTTEAMIVGSAFHRVLEHMETGEHNEGKSGDFAFDFGAINVAFERPRRREFAVSAPLGGALLSGRIDAELPCGAIVDWKTTMRTTLPMEHYAASWQWRAYLFLTGAREFRYELFALQPTEEANAYRVWLHGTLRCYAYEGMEADLAQEVAEAAWVKRRLRDG